MSEEKVIDLFDEEEKVDFTEEEVSSGMLETVTGKKKIDISGLGTIVLRQPTREDEMEADVERSKAFTRYLLDGLKTESEMQKIAEERGIWTEKDEQGVSDLQQRMVDIRVEITQAKSGNKKKKLQKELIDTRTKWMQEFARKNAVCGHTVESKALSTWWQYLTFRCTFWENGERVWKTWSNFLDEMNSGPSMTLSAEFMVFYNGLSENFFDLWAGEEIMLPESGESDGE